MVPIKILW